MASDCFSFMKSNGITMYYSSGFEEPTIPTNISNYRNKLYDEMMKLAPRYVELIEDNRQPRRRKLMEIVNIEATTIPDAWFQCVSRLLECGFRYEIQHGSFVGETRIEFDYVTVHIRYPYADPYDLMLPEIPSHLNIPNPVEPGYVEQYLPYLMSGEKQPGEDYTYGERLCKVFLGYDEADGPSYGNQIYYWINVLKETPNTNQAVLQVAQPSDCLLEDPPCLRHVDMQVKDGTLIFYSYWRSWDLWNGFPANLAGLAVLQKYMADEIGIKMGPMVASSKSLHLYKYVEELAKLRTNKSY